MGTSDYAVKSSLPLSFLRSLIYLKKSLELPDPLCLVHGQGVLHGLQVHLCFPRALRASPGASLPILHCRGVCTAVPLAQSLSSLQLLLVPSQTVIPAVLMSCQQWVHPGAAQDWLQHTRGSFQQLLTGASPVAPSPKAGAQSPAGEQQ